VHAKAFLDASLEIRHCLGFGERDDILWGCLFRDFGVDFGT